MKSSAMSAPSASAPLADAPARPVEWRRAWTALRQLIDDPKRTDQVFEIIDALSGNSWERGFQRFCAHPDGRRLLGTRPDLLAALSDRQALARLPEGSFGRAYVEFMESGRLTADGLVEAENMVQQRHPQTGPIDPDREYVGDRLRDMHDLWHVLTGYGMDEAGEAANLAFSLAQVRNPGIALIVLAAIVIGPKDVRLSWPRYLYRAWRRGRRAVLLSVVPYEELLPLPLEDVRRRLHIQPAAEAHPAGIVVANRDEGLDTFYGNPTLTGVGRVTDPQTSK